VVHSDQSLHATVSLNSEPANPARVVIDLVVAVGIVLMMEYQDGEGLTHSFAELKAFQRLWLFGNVHQK
jgi:hypothetical protein